MEVQYMQEKKIIGKTYEGTEEYVAFFVKGYYVLVQESSLCGLDYTIYDANFREIDGGVITDNETDDKLAFGCDMLAEIDSSIMFNDIVIVDYNMVTAIVDKKPEFTTKEKPIVAVDFDGTLVNCQYPQMENPDLLLISYIKKHRNDYIWILNTCRKGQELLDAVYYLANEHNVFFDYINENTVEDNLKTAIEKNADIVIFCFKYSICSCLDIFISSIVPIILLYIISFLFFSVPLKLTFTSITKYPPY